MKRNRKVKKNAALKSGTMGIASLIVSDLIMTMIYYVLDSRCTLIARDIGKVERRFTQLEAECVREAARWVVRRRSLGPLGTFGQDCAVRVLAQVRDALAKDFGDVVPAPSLLRDWQRFN